MNNEQLIIDINGIKKEYRLGQINNGTLRADWQSMVARLKKQDDPNSIIGQTIRIGNGRLMALNGIDLKVYQGDRLGIIGGNGAGKTTLLKLLARVTSPSAGSIKYNGRITSMLEVGTGFNGEMTGRENIYLNGAILGMSKAEIDAKMESIIQFSECIDFIDTPVKRYSSGMYVKLAFAVASHLDSEIMIMDEVLAVGDMNFQTKCLNKMKELATQEKKTILYVSHNMATIRQLCNRCIVLKDGQLNYDGNVEEAIQHYLGSGEEHSTVYHLQETDRWQNPTKVQLLGLEFFEKTAAFFNAGERMRIKVRWIAHETVTHTYLRMDMKYIDMTEVGVTIANLGAANQGETIESIIEFDCTNIAEGKYYFTVALNPVNTYTMGATYDDLKAKIYFEIGVQSATDRGWNHTNLGHFMPNQMTVISRQNETEDRV